MRPGPSPTRSSSPGISLALLNPSSRLTAGDSNNSRGPRGDKSRGCRMKRSCWRRSEVCGSGIVRWWRMYRLRDLVLCCESGHLFEIRFQVLVSSSRRRLNCSETRTSLLNFLWKGAWQGLSWSAAVGRARGHHRIHSIYSFELGLRVVQRPTDPKTPGSH